MLIENWNGFNSKKEQRDYDAFISNLYHAIHTYTKIERTRESFNARLEFWDWRFTKFVSTIRISNSIGIERAKLIKKHVRKYKDL